MAEESRFGNTEIETLNHGMEGAEMVCQIQTLNLVQEKEMN